MRILETKDPVFEKTMALLERRLEAGSSGAGKAVERIIKDVKRRGDAAVLAWTKRLDGASYTARSMRVSEREMAKAEKLSDPETARALKKAARRIKKFHARQREKGWSFRDEGVTLGQAVTPLSSAGVYVPGGKAAYPSSVLMNVIPAKIAGVPRVVMTTPAPGGKINPHVLLAAKIAGVDEIYKIGGAQAVGALAYGTRTIKPVDKIVGPGNVYVAEAKRRVFGAVDIDMIAGPSEILVIADSSANPAHAAADLLSQAEHDENAYPILVTTSKKFALAVNVEMERQIEKLPRAAIVKKCLRKNCYCFIARSMSEAIEIANRFAPEHLELLVKNARGLSGKIKNAGAVFAGPWTPEALGDYMAGPNHVLPTGGAARFSSPLGVYDFVKRTSLLSFDERGFRKLAGAVIALAEEEGLSAHANAVKMRLKEK
ncbi:MAG: histidinol dehydrogenase [Candidatus Nitrospinota bacterium M3_3B_026]